MGIIESARGVLWARRRQPDEIAYAIALGHERFSPAELIEQAVAAEHAGFDAICCSDHLAPWWEPRDGTPASCGNAWVWLGAAGQATKRSALGSAVTALTHRYNPVVVAQQVATLEALCPGRAFLGAGSGEAMNEVPAGMRWPPLEEQLARTGEALGIITRLLDGLERCQLVRKASCAADARVTYAEITDAGRARLTEARASHLAGVRTLFAERYDDDELITLVSLLGRLPQGPACPG